MPSRRRVLRALGSTAAAGLAGCGGRVDTGTPTGSQTDSPTRSPTATQSPTATDTETDTADTPDVACDATWTADSTWSGDLSGYLTWPTLADGTLYVGAGDGLHAFDPADGATRWRRPDVEGGVAHVADGVALVSRGLDGVVALSTADGERLWSFEPPGEHARIAGSAPVHDGVVYVGASHVPTPETVVEEPYGRLYAFDLATGEERFVADLTREDREWVQPEDVVAGDAGVFCTVDTGGLLGVAHDGTVRWRRHGDDWYYHPELVDDVVLQPTSRTVVTVDAASGETVREDDGPEMAVAVADGVAYGSGGGGPDVDGTLVAFDVASGRHRWEATVSGCGGPPAVGDGVLATPVGCRDHPRRVTLFDADSGCRYGRFQPESDVSLGLAVDDGRLYAVTEGDDGGTVRAFPLP